jgi:hypothetical protein
MSDASENGDKPEQQQADVLNLFDRDASSSGSGFLRVEQTAEAK